MAETSSVRGSVVVLGVFECRTEVDAPRGQPVRVVVGEVDVVRLHEEARRSHRPSPRRARGRFTA